MKKIILNAYGLDKPGIVLKITEIIKKYNGNIEISKMVQLESDFTLLMLVKINNKDIDILFNELNKINDLKISGKITNERNQLKKTKTFSFSINTFDNEGIIYKFSNLFKKFDINIISMDTIVKNAPDTGYPIFILESILKIPKNVAFEKFNVELNKIAEKNDIDFKLFESE